MSYSSIIKLHNLRPQRVIVGPEAPSLRFHGFVALQEHGPDAAPGPPDGDGSTEAASHPHPVGWVAEAQNIVSDARAHAEAILNEARLKADEVKTVAHREGYEKGYAEASATARADVLDQSRRIAEMARNAVADTTEILRSLEEGIVELALSIAEKVVYKSLAEDRSLVISMVKGALDYVDVADVIRVRVNPEDLDVLRSYWEDGQTRLAGKSIELTADPTVQLGGCIIDSKGSIVDAQIETKLAEVEKAFRSGMNVSTR